MSSALKSIYSPYVAGEKSAVELLRTDFQNTELRKDTYKQAAAKSISGELAEIIKIQNSEYPASKKRDEHVAALSEGNTLAVITGQQTGLFLNPALIYYKIATAIFHAKEIENESGLKTVPVFWLQSEDHDFDEIRQCNLLNTDDGILKLSLGEDTEERVSVAHRNLGNSLTDTLNELTSSLSSHPHSEEIISTLQQSYKPGSSISSAFAKTVASLFAEDGLIVFDASDERLTSLTQEIYQKAFDKAGEISQLLIEQTESLKNNSFAPQVHIRENSPLFFLHRDSESGPRFRIKREDDYWRLIGADYNSKLENSELAEIITNKPQLLSSSALIRPIIQDHLFPTAAYVGGPAEINYSAQNAPLYEFFGVNKPLLIPRASFSIVEERAARLLEKLDLNAEQILQSSRQELLKTAIKNAGGDNNPEQIIHQAKTELSNTLDALANSASELEATLEKPAKKIKDKTFSSLEGFEKKLLEAYERQNSVVSQRIDRLFTLLIPEGIPQERYYSATYFLARYGEEFRNKVFKELKAFKAVKSEIHL